MAFLPETCALTRRIPAPASPRSFMPVPLPFRRIVVSFFDEDAAIRVRQVWDGEAILGEGAGFILASLRPSTRRTPTWLFLKPESSSSSAPPPSPPHGWEMRLEDTPNKMVHAEDLAEALARARHQSSPNGSSPISPRTARPRVNLSWAANAAAARRSSSSRLLRRRQPNLPCVTVDDMTDEPGVQPYGFYAIQAYLSTHARPPVELMHSA